MLALLRNVHMCSALTSTNPSCSARRHEHENSASAWDRWCGKHSAFAWLTQTQLAPVIWAIILGLVAIFVFRVC